MAAISRCGRPIAIVQRHGGIIEPVRPSSPVEVEDQRVTTPHSGIWNMKRTERRSGSTAPPGQDEQHDSHLIQERRLHEEAGQEQRHII